MSEPVYRHLTGRTEQGVLVLTVTTTNVRNDRDADALRREFIRAVDDSGSLKVVINLAGVETVSSTGLRPLLGVLRHLDRKNGRLLLCGLSASLARTLSITRLVGVNQSPFAAEPDVAAAVARLAGED